MKQKVLEKSEGYTLIEVVIVMMITATVFVSIYALFARSMQADTEGRYEIVAAELAQEGVEIIKSKREQNEMIRAIWNGMNDEPTAYDDIKDWNSECNPKIDLDLKIFSCDNTSTKIKYDSSLKKYKSSCSGSTCVGAEFDRKCTVKLEPNDSNPYYARAVCTVEWDSLLLSQEKRKVTTELILTDWQE
jgi:prepilin-type N-terminal cleavage/methylation domain-containing protein